MWIAIDIIFRPVGNRVVNKSDPKFFPAIEFKKLESDADDTLDQLISILYNSTYSQH